MTNITKTDAITVGETCYASVISDKFSDIQGVLSGKLDSENYKDANVLSQHISSDAVRSQHISDSQVVGFSLHAVQEKHMDYASSNTGARVLRYGVASTDGGMRPGGVAAARMTQTFGVPSNTSQPNATFSFTAKFSNAIEGEPSFFANPNVNQPQIFFPGSQSTNTRTFLQGGNMGPFVIQITGLDTEGVSFRVRHNSSLAASDTYVCTAYFVAIGALKSV
jgi:hypothetical protein